MLTTFFVCVDRESFKTKSFYTGITSWGGANDQPEVNGTSSSTATQGTQLKECMRNTYCQTMPPQHDSLMQGPESSHRTTSMGTTSSGSSHSSRAQELHKSCPTEDRASPTHGGHPPHNLSNVGDDLDGIQGISDDDDPLERPTIYDSGPHSLYYSAHDPTQSDWETSFALVSTSRPATSDPFVMSESRPSRGAESARTSSDADFRMALEDDPGAVDSLHMEIQRLQARIMNRLRDSSSGLEVTAAQVGLAFEATRSLHRKVVLKNCFVCSQQDHPGVYHRTNVSMVRRGTLSPTTPALTSDQL